MTEDCYVAGWRGMLQTHGLKGKMPHEHLQSLWPSWTVSHVCLAIFGFGLDDVFPWAYVSVHHAPQCYMKCIWAPGIGVNGLVVRRMGWLYITGWGAIKGIDPIWPTGGGIIPYTGTWGVVIGNATGAGAICGIGMGAGARCVWLQGAVPFMALDCQWEPPDDFFSKWVHWTSGFLAGGPPKCKLPMRLAKDESRSLVSNFPPL